jgi:hypothetical protein
MMVESVGDSAPDGLCSEPMFNTEGAVVPGRPARGSPAGTVGAA